MITATVFWVLVMTSTPKGAPPQLSLMGNELACRRAAAELNKQPNSMVWCVPMIEEKK